jgi:xylose isomerase
MDIFARGLLIADKIISNKSFDSFIEKRYSSFNSGIGAEIISGKAGFTEIEKWVLKNDQPKMESGRQEMLENILNNYLR